MCAPKRRTTENSAGNRAGGKWEHKRDALRFERMQRRHRRRPQRRHSAGIVDVVINLEMPFQTVDTRRVLGRFLAKPTATETTSTITTKATLRDHNINS